MKMLRILSSGLLFCVMLFVGYFFIPGPDIADAAGTVGVNTGSFNGGTGFNANVDGAIKLASGKILAWGDFTSYNGTTRNKIARINADGTLDAAFDPGTGPAGGGAQLYDAVELSDGTVVVVGVFSSFNGSTRGSIVRLDTNGSVNTSFDSSSGGLNGAVYGIEKQTDDKVLVLSNSTLYNGVSTGSSRLIRINTDGTRDGTYAPSFLNSVPSVIAPTVFIVDSSNRAIVWGTGLNTCSGGAANGFCRLTSTGAYDSTFQSGIGATSVSSLSGSQGFLELSDGGYLVTGSATQYDGNNQPVTNPGVDSFHLWKITSTGLWDATFTTPIDSPSVAQIVTMAEQPDGKILLGGLFSGNYNGTGMFGSLRINADGSGDSTYDSGTGVLGGSVSGGAASVQALIVFDDDNHVALGSFATYDGNAVPGVTGLLAPTSVKVAGTVYTDEGTTNIGAGKTVTLLINGALADCGTGAGSCQADTNASGQYEITGAAVTAITANDILTVFIDDETENGVTVTVADDNSYSDMHIYQNYLIARHDNSGSLTNTNLATADNADQGTSLDDLSTIYSVDGSNNLTTTTGTELLTWTGDVFAPGANIIAGGTVDVDGTMNIAANTISIAGNLDVAGTWTDSVGASITMNGTAAQMFNQGSAAINSDIIIANTSAAVNLTTNAMNIGANDLTVNANATLALGGLNITAATGTFSNDGTVQANGAETLVNLTNDTNSGTWEFIDDTDGTAEVVTIGGVAFPFFAFYNLTINDTEATPANRDTFQMINNGVVVNGNFNATSGTFGTSNFASDFNGNVIIGTNGLFSAGSSAITIAGNFSNSSGVGFVAGSSTVTFDPDTNHNIIGATQFNNLTFQNTTDDTTDNTLTFGNSANYVISGNLILDGLDTNDRVLIVSDLGGTAATINVTGGSANVTADFLNVTDNTLQDNGTTMNPELGPANSINGGNTAGWFPPADVEFSTTTASSTNEATANNFPTLRINGTVYVATSVDIDVTGGTATNGGTDYTMTDPLTVNIPAGTYDGTSGTEIAITAPTLNNDNLVESGGETIALSLINFGSSEVRSGDADGADGNESTHTYTITDDDSMVVELTTNASDAENTGGNLPQLLILGTSTAVSTVTVTDAGTGSATGGGTDYSFTSAQVIAIPAGTYDGTTGTAIAIPTLSITGDTDLEANETIDFALSAPTGDASLGDANTDTATTTAHTYTITNDDTATASISVTDATAAENPSDNGEFTVTLSKANNTGGPITVNYSVGGTATAGSDFAALSGTVTIANGASTGVITIDTSGLNDATVEGFKTVTLVLTGTSNTDVSIGTNAATLSITDDEDGDGDGVATATEDAGFNGGDGNGDGILDSIQSDVTNVTNPVTSGTTTVQVSGGACNVVGNVAGLAESSLGQSDSSYDYPVGLMQFLVECTNPGDTATITIFYDQVYTTTNWEFRKFNDKTNTYADIDATTTVTITSTNLANGAMAGTQVTTVTYDVTDGSALDTDANPPLSDRYIFDPSGPGTPVVVASSGGGGGGGVPLPAVCQDPTATNFESYGSHTPSLCIYAATDDTATDLTNPTTTLQTENSIAPATTPAQASVDAVIGSGQCSNELIISQNLRKGARDGQYEAYTDATVTEVALLQAHINRILAAQYNQAAGPVDGIFGSLTKRGVQRLQTALNQILQPAPPLVIDGIVGPFTRGAINNSCGYDNQQQHEIPLEEPTVEPVQEIVAEPATEPTATEEEVYEAITDKVTTAQCPFFTQYLIQGSQGDSVRSVEVFMGTLGYDVGSADGVFDSELHRAIIAYQQDHWEDILKPWNLGPNEGTGYLYQSTRAHMNNRAGCPICVTLDNGQRVGCDDKPASVIEPEVSKTPVITPPAPCRDTFTQNAKRGDRGDHVTEIQQFLYDRGYLPEEPVGYFGPLTESAVRQFQGQYRDQILTPLGYEGTTGFWHGRTRDQANEIVCQDLIDNN